ncbi:MAG: hypothetical protein ACKOBR_08455, partial [Actinomycetota bacterium]
GKGSALLMCTIREVSAVGSKLQRKRFGDDNDNVVEYDEFLDNHGSVGTVSHSGADYGPTSQRTSEARMGSGRSKDTTTSFDGRHFRSNHRAH